MNLYFNLFWKSLEVLTSSFKIEPNHLKKEEVLLRRFRLVRKFGSENLHRDLIEIEGSFEWSIIESICKIFFLRNGKTILYL